MWRLKGALRSFRAFVEPLGRVEFSISRSKQRYIHVLDHLGVNRQTSDSTTRAVRRLSQLDAVRGIAALIVVLEHFSDLFYRRAGVTLTDPVSVLKASPLAILVQGPAAVATFFVLSGFVLSLPFEHSTISSTRFVVKRVLRLYLPFVAGLSLAAIGDAALSTHGIPTLNAWFNSSWTHPVDVADLLNHSLLVNHFEFDEYNKAYWTLAYEMQISLIFPVLFWFCALLKSRTLFYVSLMMMLLGTVHMRGVPDEAVYLISVAGMFILGLALARNREELKITYAAQPPSLRWILGASVLLIFAYSGPLGRAFKPVDIAPALRAIAAGIIVVSALADGRWMGFLVARPCQFLGRISYSLYLVHLSVLYSLIYLSYPEGASPSGTYWLILFIGYILLALMVSVTFHFLFEDPCTRLSQKV